MRILALGDSVTFGWGTAQDAVFTHGLADRLGHALARPVRVINAGVGGYNTSQEVAFYQQSGDALGADLVLLTYVTNDVETFTRAFRPVVRQIPRR